MPLNTTGGAWQEIVEADGAIYYWNAETGTSSWTMPPDSTETREPAPAPERSVPQQKLMYRGSNSDTQLSGHSKLAWGLSNPPASRTGSSERNARPRTSSGRTWEAWTTEEVIVWVANLDIDTKECIEAFRVNRIKGKHLMRLDDSMLEKLGVLAFGDRSNILDARDDLVADDGSRVLAEAERRAMGDLTSNSASTSPSASPVGRPGSASMRRRAKSALWDSPPAERESEPQVWVDEAGDPLVIYTDRPVGGGAGGAVFEGWYQGSLVAVKRMNELDKQALKELDVYKNSRAHRHSNLVYYHGFKIEHGLVYLVMDLCHCSLSRSCKNAREFLAIVADDLDLQRKLAKDLLSGLASLHSLGIVHRDIKPANVLVSSPDQPRLCICDMGLTKRRDAAVSMSTAGDAVGTPSWRAPELSIAIGTQQQATEMSDIFAVALVLFHMFTGGRRHVFDDDVVDDDMDEKDAASADSHIESEHFLRQHRIDRWGQKWTKVMELDTAQEFLGDFVEKLADEPASNPFMRPETPMSSISGDAACLLGRMLHPDPKKRPSAGQALADLYFQSELCNEDELSMEELEIGDIIGDGAFGVVFRAKWRETDVAVKRLKPQPQNSHGDFKREVQLLKRLRHPHVVLFMGWFWSCADNSGKKIANQQSLCLVTELCWTSLYRFLHESKMQLPWARVLGMSLDGARGMCFLHGENIVHRDLKSANLLIDRSYRVKVCDFGLAKALSQTAASRGEQGTPQYDAPELILQGKQADKKSDVYSFGVVMWELALRRRPFDVLLEKLGKVHLSAHIATCYQRGEGLSLLGWPQEHAEMQRLVAACLSMNPDERPMFDAVAAAINQEALHLRKQTAAQTMKRPLSKATQQMCGTTHAPKPPRVPSTVNESDTVRPRNFGGRHLGSASPLTRPSAHEIPSHSLGSGVESTRQLTPGPRRTRDDERMIVTTGEAARLEARRILQ